VRTHRCTCGQTDGANGRRCARAIGYPNITSGNDRFVLVRKLHRRGTLDTSAYTDANKIGHLRYANSSAERCLSRLITANIKR